MQDTLQGEREELASCSGTLYMPTFSARADSAKYVDIYYPKPQGFDPKRVVKFFLERCVLVTPGLSKWSFNGAWLSSGQAISNLALADFWRPLVLPWQITGVIRSWEFRAEP